MWSGLYNGHSRKAGTVKFGANTWIWTSPLTTTELGTLIPHVASLGFNWIEFPIETPDGYDYRRAGELARENGLGVSVAAAMGPDRDLIHPDASIRANGMAFVRHCIDAAHTMGAANLIGPLYAAVGRTWQATAAERAHEVDLLVQQLLRLAQPADDAGVTLCIEPLNRFETSFLNLATQAIEIVDRVNHPACQLMLDTFHMNIEERSLGDAIRAAGVRLRHVHACENDRGAPGAGHVPWQEVAQALRDIQYDGPIVIESFTDKVTTIARAAAIWRPLASSQDALAGDGLAFLKKLING
jgi:D-psicose/D-tagatose/L-ribulose 3-epimerase